MSSLFKIKIKPIIKNRDWKINQVTSGRKQKICNVCLKYIPIGTSSITFTQIISSGMKSRYEALHTCSVACGLALADKLDINFTQALKKIKP